MSIPVSSPNQISGSVLILGFGGLPHRHSHLDFQARLRFVSEAKPPNPSKSSAR